MLLNDISSRLTIRIEIREVGQLFEVLNLLDLVVIEFKFFQLEAIL
jgi:hypothetical protein